jgi:hypothetical protein
LRPSLRPSLFALATLIGAFGSAGPAQAVSQTAKVSAKVVKPLTIKWVQDLDLGTITLGSGTWSNATVAITRGGMFSCTSSNVTCSGATNVATYNIVGSNNQSVRVSAPNVTLVNQADPARTLTLVVDGPGTVTIPNSGNRGVDVSLGGSITLTSATASGVYSGTFNVTVDY